MIRQYGMKKTFIFNKKEREKRTQMEKTSKSTMISGKFCLDIGVRKTTHGDLVLAG